MNALDDAYKLPRLGIERRQRRVMPAAKNVGGEVVYPHDLPFAGRYDPRSYGSRRWRSAMWTEAQRRIYRREGEGYPSDLRNEEWARLEPMIPPARPGGRPRKTDMRAAMNAIL